GRRVGAACPVGRRARPGAAAAARAGGGGVARHQRAHRAARLRRAARRRADRAAPPTRCGRHRDRRHAGATEHAGRRPRRRGAPRRGRRRGAHEHREGEVRMKTTRLALATAGVPLAALAAVYAVRAAWSDRLPDVVVSHWGTDGPDRGTDLAAMTGWTLGLGAAVAVVATVGGLVSHARGSGAPRSAVGFVAWLATLPGGVLAGSMWASLDTTSWQQAGSAVGAVAIAFGVSVAAGALAAWLAGPTVRAVAPSPRDLPSA